MQHRSPSQTEILPRASPCVALKTRSSAYPENAAEDRMQPALVVFSGGTAFNSIAGSLRQLTTKVAHVLPVSDDGGSTAEIVRVLGGPAVGDIRSRCLRLADDSNDEANAVKALLAHRLSSQGSAAAKAEWFEIVEGQHLLYTGMSEPYKHTIRAFLVYFHTQILRHSTERFNFTNGSVGNFFFAGARVFLRSLEAAIFMFGRVARIPEGSVVLPAICTEERIVLGAQLSDGSIIRGQNAISHPSPSGGARSPGLKVDKVAFSPMPAPVQRIYYLSTDEGTTQHEVWPAVNPAVLTNIDAADALVYGIGSLLTSICPTLVLHGVGEHIAACSAPKIFLINGSHDRETTALPSALEDLPHFCSATAREDSWASTHDSMQQPIEPDHHTGTATHRFSADSAQLAGSTPPDPELDRGPNDDAHADGATSAAGSSRHRGDSKATGRQSQAPAYNPGGTLQAEPPEPTSNAATDGSEDVGSPAHRFRQLTLNTTEAHGPPQTYKPQNNVRYMKASDMVLAICDALNRTHAPTANRPLSHTPEAYVTALIAPQRGEVQVDSEMLRQLGIRCIVEVESCTDDHGRAIYEPEALVEAIDHIMRLNARR